MLTASVDFSATSDRCTQQNGSFEDKCTYFLTEVSRNKFPYTTPEQEACIYQNMHPFFPLNHDIVLTSTTMVQWMQILSRFSAGDNLGALLKNTEQAIQIRASEASYFNLQELITLLAQFTFLLKEQTVNRTLFSAEDPTTYLENIVPTLHDLIIQIIRNKSSLNPEQISTILTAIGSSAFIVKGEEAEKIFSVLTEQINRNSAQQHNFSDDELQNAFCGLRHSHERNSDALTSLLQALLPLLQNAKINDQEISARVLSYVVYSLKNSPGNIATAAILEHATIQLNTYAAAQQWISSDAISRIIVGLASMQKNAEAEALLTALQPHIQKLSCPTPPANIQSFSLMEMGMMLEGLQNFAHSNVALSILKELTSRLSTPSHIASQTIDLEKWLANAIYSLGNYLDETASPQTRTIAMAFIDTAINKLNLAQAIYQRVSGFTIEALSTTLDREFYIIKIGNFIDEGASDINLLGYSCSRALVRFIAQFVWELEQNDAIEILGTFRPIYFSYDDDNPVKKSLHAADERQWIKTLFTEKFSSENTRLSRSSGTSSTSHTNYIEEEYDRENVASAAAAQ